MNWPSSWTVSYLFIYPAISSWKNCQINSPQASSPGWAHNCSVSTTVPIFFTYQSTSQQQSRAPGVQLTSQQSSSQSCLRHCLLYQTQSLDLKIISDVKRCVTAFVCPSQCLYIYMRRSEHTAEIASSMLSEIEKMNRFSFYFWTRSVSFSRWLHVKDIWNLPIKWQWMNIWNASLDNQSVQYTRAGCVCACIYVNIWASLSLYLTRFSILKTFAQDYIPV